MDGGAAPEHRDLLCCENASVELDMKCQAYHDPVLLKDKRVFENLLSAEECYMPSSSYFTCVQTDVEPYMREMVAQWMLCVTHEERREEEVFTLAMNLLDRFLSLVHLKRQQLQLLGAVCLLLSSKLKETPPLDAHRLVELSDDTFTLEELKAWELLVLSRLKWDLSAITPHAFLDQIIERLGLGLSPHQREQVRQVASFCIRVCATNANFATNPPSMVAAAVVAFAVQQCEPPACPLPDLLHRLHNVTHIDVDNLKEVYDQIEKWTRHDSNCASSSTSGTPTDVQDVDF